MTSQKDLQFLKIMEQGIKKAEAGHYEMPLPFKERPICPTITRVRSLDLNISNAFCERFKVQERLHEVYERNFKQRRRRGSTST